MALRRIRLPNGDELGEVGIEPLGGERYRMLEHPLVDNWCGLHDIVHGTEDSNGLVQLTKVVERGPWRTLCVGLSLDLLESNDCRRELEQLQARGGHWDRAMGGLLWLHIPRKDYRRVGRPFILWLRRHGWGNRNP